MRNKAGQARYHPHKMGTHRKRTRALQPVSIPSHHKSPANANPAQSLFLMPTIQWFRHTSLILSHSKGAYVRFRVNAFPHQQADPGAQPIISSVTSHRVASSGPLFSQRAILRHGIMSPIKKRRHVGFGEVACKALVVDKFSKQDDRGGQQPSENDRRRRLLRRPTCSAAEKQLGHSRRCSRSHPIEATARMMNCNGRIAPDAILTAEYDVNSRRKLTLLPA